MHQVFPFTTPLIQFGMDTIDTLGQEAKNLGAGKVLIVTGPSVAKHGALDRAITSLKAVSIEYVVDIVERDTPEPATSIAEETAKKILSEDAKVIVGIGGGSVLDVAKMSSALAVNPGKVRDYFGKGKVPKRGRPTIMVPTTSGTGAEVTKHAIFLDKESEVKKAVASNALLPNVAIVDPMLTVSCPPSVTAAAGIDAFIHAAEPYLSKLANPLTGAIALESVKIIYNNLGPAYADGDNLDARYWMSMGSMMSGLVLNNSGTSLVHALAYPIGGEFHTPHGLSLTAIILSCFEYISLAKLDHFVRLAKAINEPVEGLSKREIVTVFLDALREWMIDLELPVCLSDLDITDKGKVTRWAIEGHNEQRLLSRCARNLTVKDCENIYNNAF